MGLTELTWPVSPLGMASSQEYPCHEDSKDSELFHRSTTGKGSTLGLLGLTFVNSIRAGQGMQEVRHASRNADSACPFLPSQKGAR